MSVPASDPPPIGGDAALPAAHDTALNTALRESEARFRLIADSTPSPVWVTDAAGRAEFANAAMASLLRLPPEALIGLTAGDIIHPEDAAAAHKARNEARLNGRPAAFDCRFGQRGDNHDDVWRWVRATINPRFGIHGDFLGYVGMAFDISETRAAAEALARQERRQSFLLDLTDRLRDLSDPEAIMSEVERALGDVLDVDRVGYGEVDQDQGLLSLSQDWTAGVASARGRFDLNAFGAELIAALASGRTVRIADVNEDPSTASAAPAFSAIQTRALIRTPLIQGGRLQAYLYVHSASPRQWSDAEAGLVEEVARRTWAEIQRARAQQEMRRINERLEDRISEALAEKAQAEAELMHAQRLEAVGRLTGGVAHDFNNLLTVVIGALDMILRSPDDAARRKKLGEAALAAARRGEGLTHQLLAFSRRQALRPEATDLNALITESEPLLRRAVGEAVEFSLDLRPEGAEVSIDPGQFEAALLNLIVNARDAVGDRGAISVQTRLTHIQAGEAAELAPGPYVCVIVSDNGVGMDAETMGRVFEPFFTTKSIGKGTGLGLSQVYGFARQSGGGVRITSTPGHGSEMRLYLPPLAPPDPSVAPKPALATASEDDAVALTGQRLLLVEDDQAVAMIAVDLLEAMGLEVVAVDTGPQALDLLGASHFDVMITDVVMPGGMTGIELARICHALHPRINILLTSGYAGDDVDEALADAPWPFLRKPYSGEQLQQALTALTPRAADAGQA